MHRSPNQCHLNSKESGDETRKKRHSKRIETSTNMVRNIIEFRNR